MRAGQFDVGCTCMHDCMRSSDHLMCMPASGELLNDANSGYNSISYVYYNLYHIKSLPLLTDTSIPRSRQQSTTVAFLKLKLLSIIFEWLPPTSYDHNNKLLSRDPVFLLCFTIRLKIWSQVSSSVSALHL